MPRITQLPPIKVPDISDDDLLAIVDLAANQTDNISLLALKTYILNSVSSEIPVSQTIYVDPLYGDDGTGLRERLDLPFQSISSALSASLAGDTIVLRPGDHYVYANVVKDGVSIYGEEGSNVYSFTNLINASPFEGGTALTGNWYWLGYSKVVYCSGPIINIKNNPTAILNLEFDILNGNNLSNSILPQDGLINLRVRYDYISLGRNFSCRLSGNINAVIGGLCRCTYNNPSNGIFWISGTSWTGKANIKAKSFDIPNNAVGGNHAHFYYDNMIGGEVNIELDELIDTSNVTQAAIIVSNAFTNTAGIVNIKIKKAIMSRPLFSINNAISNVVLEIGNSNSGANNFSNGSLLIRNSLVKNILGKVIGVSGGTLSLMGSTLVSDGVNPTISNTGGTILSQGSKGNVAPSNPVVGNFYINPLYTN
jgi:hypothetical protein